MTQTDVSTSQTGLRAGAIGLGGDLIAAIVNVAPSSSVAFTLALLVGFTGKASPLPTLLVGLAMAFCALGYARFNRWRASAGAAYLWVGASINPVAGVGTGLLSAVTSTLANTGNTTLAGSYLLLVLFLAHSPAKVVVWLTAAVVVGAMLWLSVAGIRPSVRVQLGLMIAEYSVVVSFVVLALIHEASGAGGASLPSLSDFTVSSSLFGFKGIAESAVIASFLYGSWETPSALGEETTNSRFNPGRAMIAGTIFLAVWYTFLVAVFEGISSRAQVVAHGSDVLAYAGTVLASGFAARLLPIAVLLAVIGTTQMQMMQPSRILYSMARDGLIPKLFGRLRKGHQTPWMALLILAAIPMVVLIPYLANSTVSSAIGDVVGAVGMLYLFLYFMVAVSSVWFHRTEIIKGGARIFILYGVLPLIGGLFCLVMFGYGLTTQTKAVAIVSGVGVVAVYLLAVVIRLARPDSPFFAEMASLRRPGGRETGSPEAPDEQVAPSAG